jgi:hypothetical protein
VQLLREAVEKGYRDFRFLKEDSQLEILRRGPDCRKLLEGLGAKSNPKTR